MPHVEGVKSFIAGEALAAHTRVKIESGTVTNPPEVVAAGDGETHIGIVESTVADGDTVAVRLRHHNGTQEAIAAEAFAVGAVLYGAASGKVADTSSGTAIGVAIEAATADGDVVEILET